MVVPKYPTVDGSEVCRSTDPEIFFPDSLTPKMAKRLRTICADCHVQAACAEWAIWFEADGFWGGLTPNERKEIRRERGIIKQNIAA